MKRFTYSNRYQLVDAVIHDLDISFIEFYFNEYNKNRLFDIYNDTKRRLNIFHEQHTSLCRYIDDVVEVIKDNLVPCKRSAISCASLYDNQYIRKYGYDTGLTSDGFRQCLANLFWMYKFPFKLVNNTIYGCRLRSDGEKRIYSGFKDDVYKTYISDSTMSFLKAFYARDCATDVLRSHPSKCYILDIPKLGFITYRTFINAFEDLKEARVTSVAYDINKTKELYNSCGKFTISDYARVRGVPEREFDENIIQARKLMSICSRR